MTTGSGIEGVAPVNQRTPGDATRNYRWAKQPPVAPDRMSQPGLKKILLPSPWQHLQHLQRCRSTGTFSRAQWPQPGPVQQRSFTIMALLYHGAEALSRLQTVTHVAIPGRAT